MFTSTIMNVDMPNDPKKVQQIIISTKIA